MRGPHHADWWRPGPGLVAGWAPGTLRTIATEGAPSFYRGAIAQRIASDMAQNGGLITLDDLAQYRAIERKPLSGQYRDYRVFSAPPPVATGAALIETLQILENYPAKHGAAYVRDPGFLHGQ